MFDKRDPYYLDDDAFASINSTEKAVKKLHDLEYRKYQHSLQPYMCHIEVLRRLTKRPWNS